MNEVVLTLQEAADRLKVHYMTAYRWVRRGELPAIKAGGRIRVRETDLESFLVERALDVAMPADEPGRTDWDAHVARLHELLWDGRGAEAAALVRKVVADGAAVTDVYVELLAPALHRVGDDWAAGHLSVAGEHRATEITKAILSRIGETFRRRGPSRGTVVTLTPPDELHGLGSTMLADVLRGGGFEVHHLGPNVPVEDLGLFLQVVPTDVVCASVTRTDLDAAVVHRLAETVRANGVQLLLGGQGVDEALAHACGATYLAELRSVHEAVAHLLHEG